MTDRTPPQNIEAERSCLGAVLIKPAAWQTVGTALHMDAFFHPAHREVFHAMGEVAKRDFPIDPITVGAELKAAGVLARLDWGEGYLLDLAGSVPTAENVDAHVQLVLDAFNKRQLIQLCAQTMSRAYLGASEAAELLEEASGDISRIVMRTTGRLTRLGECMDRVMAEINRRVELGPERASEGKVRFGIRSLDELLVGCDAGDLVVIGGDPGSGKTALAIQAGLKLAIDDGGTCFCANLEMDRYQIGERALGHRAEVSSYLIRRGDLSREDLNALYAARKAILPANFYIEDKITTVPQFEVAARAWRARHPDLVGLGIFDFLQLAGGGDAHHTRAQQVAENARRLKKLGGDLGITLIALSSLRRDANEAAEKPPTMKSLKESGDVEFAATTILLIWNRDQTKDGQVDLIAAKNKKGPTATLPLRWTGRHYRFADVDDGRGSGQQDLIDR